MADCAEFDFTIVTPTLNQSEYIADTISSVLDQQDVSVQYIIIDGGSDDATHDVIGPYLREIYHFEIVNGSTQAEAVNRGFEHASGCYLAWINSDDYYLPGSLSRVAYYFKCHPDVDVVMGDLLVVDPDKRIVTIKSAVDFDFDTALYSECLVAQPATFWRREVSASIGFLDDSLDFQMDYEYFLRMSAHGYKFGVLGSPTAAFRLHQASKTVREYERSFFHSSSRIKDAYRMQVQDRGPLPVVVYRLLKVLYRLRIYFARIATRGDVRIPYLVMLRRREVHEEQ